MKKVHLVVVGKLKDRNLEEIEKSFAQRITSLDFKVHELKSSSEDRKSEGRVIIKKIQDLKKSGSAHVAALSEFGKERSSEAYSEWLFQSLETRNQMIFLIGGAEGLDSAVYEQCDSKVSLSKLTFPHKLARLLFIEQLYRAISIKENHPYHNA